MEPPNLLRFGVFELDTDTRELRREGRRVALAPQAVSVLVVLVSRPGQLVTRDELRELLWGQDTFVEADQGLNACLRKIRRALGDDARSPRFVETLPRRGYRFIAPLSESAVAPTSRQRSATVTYVLAGSVLAIVLLAALAGLGISAKNTTDATGPVAVAVLPFEQGSLGGQDDEWDPYISKGLTEELIVALARRLPPGVSVIDYTTPAGGSTASNTAELDADFVVTGLVRQEGDAVRLTAQLRRASDGVTLWAESFDGTLGTVLEFQRAVAGSVVAELGRELTALTTRDPRLVAGPSLPTAMSDAAADAYLRGLYLLTHPAAGNATAARDWLKEAVDLEPTIPEAHAGLATAFTAIAFSQQEPAGDVFPQARRAAQRALDLDPENAEAAVALAYVQLYFDHDPAAAEATLAHAEAASPGLACVQSALAALRAVQQRHDDSVRHARLAQTLDPLGINVKSDLCWYLLYADRPTEAVAECGRALELEIGDQWALLGLAEAQLATGDGPAAARSTGRAFGLGEEEITTLDDVHEISRRISQALSERPAAAGSFSAAVFHARAGETAKALSALEAAHADRSFWMAYLHLDPRLDDLREQTRFADLVADVGLVPSTGLDSPF